MNKTWDTEKIENFIESFVGAYDRYTDDLRSFEEGMAKYYYNDTYRGQAAEASKNFIDAGQNKLHMMQIDVQRRLVSMYYHMLNEFKDKVDSSPKARIDTDILLYIKKHFKGCDRVVDVAGYDIECKARYIADKFRRINGSLTPPSYRMLGEMYEDLDGSGGLIDHCIRKFEEFDEEMYSEINQSGIEDDVDELHGQIVTTASMLDSIPVKVENVSKISLGLISLNAKAKALSPEEQKELRKKAKEIYIAKLFEKVAGSRFSATYENSFTVDDSKRVRIGKVSDTFVSVTDPNSSDLHYGGNQSWFINEPDYGKKLDANGCGAIAAVNQSLYLTGQTTISIEEYKKMVNAYMKAEDCSPDSRTQKSKNRINAVKGFTGALPGQMTEYVEHTCKNKGINVKTDWDYVQGYQNDYQNMKKQLKEGIPVIWAVNDNKENAKKAGDDTKVGVMFYEYKKGTYTVKYKAVTSHYVTATAIYEDTDATGKTRRMVEISSWGEKLYVDYDQYIDIVSDDPNNEPFSSITNTTVEK